MKRAFIILCLKIGILLLAPCVSAADTPQQARHDEIRSVLDREVPGLLVKSGVPSVSLAQIENGAIVFTAAYGSQSSGVPTTTGTLYNIASMTKPISAEVILRLASMNRLSLDEPMYRFWVDPDVATDARSKLLTPRIALSHQTGFPNWRRETGGALTFTFSPGEAFGYSGEGYEYAARFAEKKTRTSFDTLAQKWVLDAIGMRDTAYTKKSWFDGRIAVPTDATGTASKPAFAARWTASDLVYTTPTDYAKFMLSVMNGDGLTATIAADRRHIHVSRKNRLCPPSNAQTCADDVGMGLGWEISTFKGETFFMHTGMDSGVFTIGYFCLPDRSGTVIFTNSANGPKVVIPLLDMLGKNPTFVDFLRNHSG